MNAIPVVTKKGGSSPHGGGVRGAELSRRSSQFEGRFGRMFRSLPAAEWPVDALLKLGAQMTSPPELDPKDSKKPGAAFEDPAKVIQDDEENSGIPAGYTYLGQFIDHDITFDPASSLQKQNDVDGLVDFRTPRMDLDSLYGRGPGDQPYMYDGNRFRLGATLFEGFNGKKSKARDLPRYAGNGSESLPLRALIGDKRNDENVIVSQMHSAMLQFHNKLVDVMPKNTAFAEVQRMVRWHYQWVVVNDFLVKLCGKEVVHDILPNMGKNLPAWQFKPQLHFYQYKNDAFMPIEFAAAAYRFGHSMVRPIYRLNTELNGGDDPVAATPEEVKAGIAGRFFIFAGVQNRGLNGFDAFPTQWAIDWSLYFDINGSGKLPGKKRAQPSYKIDTSLVNPLGFLPEFSNVVPANPPLMLSQLQATPKDPLNNPAGLAQRNLMRGMAMALPSGQDVARAMGLTPVSDANLRIGKAVIADWDDPETPNMATFEKGVFAGKAPLWYYILAEAQYEWALRAKKAGSRGNEEPVTLGNVGKRIVAETLIGLLLADGHSYLRQAPNWTPKDAGHVGADFNMGKLIQFALS